MLESTRFRTSEPDLAQDLDRFVLELRRELDRMRTAAGRLFTLAEVVHGRAGSVIAASPKFGELVPLSPAQGALDVNLPTATAADAGRVIGLIVRSTSNACTLRPRGVLVNLAASVALPTTLAAYIVLWDGAGWWTVNDAS